MRKVIKNVLKIAAAVVSSLILAALVAPLAVSVLVSIPAVQNAIVRSLVSTVSERLGTRVSIERVDIKLINRVEISGFYVEDFRGDTLLYVPRLVAPVVETGLMGGRLILGRVELSGAELWLRRDSLGSMNIKEIVTAIRGDRHQNPDSRFRLRIMGVEAEGLSFGLRRDDRPVRTQEVDFGRLLIRDTHIELEDFEIAGDTIRMDIRSLSPGAGSSLPLDGLSARELIVARGVVALRDADILSGETDLQLPRVRLESPRRAWADFRYFADSISIGVSVVSSRISSDFLRRFVPALPHTDFVLDEVSLHTKGTLSSLSGSIATLRTPAAELSLDFVSRGLPDIKNAYIDASVRRLSTSGAAIDSLLRTFTGRGLPAGVLAPVERIGRIEFAGQLSKSATPTLAGFEARGELSSDAGVLDVALLADPGGRITAASLSTGGFDLGRTLGTDALGTVSANLSANLTASGSGTMTGKITGGISALEFRGYTYTNIAFDGALDARNLSAAVTVRDPSLDLDLAGELTGGFAESFADGLADGFGGGSHEGSPRGTTSELAARMDLLKLDLAATGLLAHDHSSVAILSGGLAAHITGSSADDATGSVELTRPGFVSSRGEIATPSITVAADADGENKRLVLRSEFADAEFRGRTSYRDILSSLTDIAYRNIPLLGARRDTRTLVPPDGTAPGNKENYSSLHLTVKDVSPLLDILTPGVQVAEGSEASLEFNPYNGRFSLQAASEFIEAGEMLAANVELRSDNAADSLTLRLTSADLYSGTMHIPAFGLHATADGHRVGISLDGKTWLRASGVISRHASDTLHVALEGFDLKPLGRLLPRGGTDRLEGWATGYLDIVSVLSDPKMNADVQFSSLSLGGIEASGVRFTSAWDDATRRIGFRMTDTARDATLLRGSLSPRTQAIEAALAVEGLDVAILDALLGGVMENTEGRADVDLKLAGSVKAPRLDGRIDIPHLKTTVGYTKAEYTLAGGSLSVVNSVLTLPHTSVSDRFGGTADLSMRVDLSNLRDVQVEIDAALQNTLALDTGPDDDESFHGRVFASGSLGIRATRMGTRMDISAQTEAGTRLNLPLGARSNVSWADFVVFADPLATPDTTNVLERKKLAYERRVRGGVRSSRRKPLEMNLAVRVTPDAEVHLPIDPNLGEGITATGEGRLGLEINPATGLFSMTGDYVISSGRFELSMMELFNKDFTIAPGSTLRWSGSPDDAMLDVAASYRVRTSLTPLLGSGSGLVTGRSTIPVDCTLHLGERLSEPEITFDIVLPSADHDTRLVAQNAMNSQELKSMQFLSLLMTGSFAADNSITGQSAGSGVMATGAVGFDILTNQLANLLSSEDYDIYFRYRPQDNFATSQFDVGLSTGFADDRLLLEIEGNYVDDRASSGVGTRNVSNLAGDVSLTWMIDRGGNLRLKVFTQTIDRLNETQGLQESGLGLYWRKDFDRFGDVFRRREKNTTFDADSVAPRGPRKKE